MSFGRDSIDWSDPAFSTSEFTDAMVAESPWGNSALNDFTNLADYSDSPAGFGLRTPSKSGADPASTGGAQQPHGLAGVASTSVESSSQDSSSDTSSNRKRKTTSESPISNPPMMKNVPVKEETDIDMNNYQNMQSFEQSFSQPLPNLTVDSSMSEGNENMFDFNSAASSPNLPRDFNQQLSLDAKMNIAPATTVPKFTQGSPVQTINPGMFTMGGSQDQSPQASNMMFNTASPNALFSTPSSDSNEAFAANQNWNTQNPAWPTDFNSQFASPGGLAFTPSPVANGGTPSMASRNAVPRAGRSPLHIAPISTKSRVETQINVVMTLEKPPPGTEQLHLPLHTIAKSKLLAKEDFDRSKVLELHTMLVCSSAMHTSALKEKALKRAAAQKNEDIQKRAEQQRESGDEDKNDMKNVPEADKPANGGEVRICNNCIQRERKRAGRKKLKKEEEQQHWERYETERVVVFNSNEYLPFKPFEHSHQPQRDGGMGVEDAYHAPEGAISVAAAMRIACYCRHQNEKEGFQVIFTLKDQQGNVVAQEMSDSILITDDHKTHPPQLATSEMLFHPAQLGCHGLPTSYSMMDLQSHAQNAFTSSRSTGNLQALAYGQQPQFNPHSHIHQLPHNGFASQGTSATMTPTSLSRPGSPTSAGQSGPNKKRKSSSFHRRLPSGLQMTPRNDTSQPQSAHAMTGASMASNFSPTGGAFAQQNDNSFMTIPNSGGPAQFFGSGPPTPANEQGQFAFGQPHQLDITRAQNASAYFSHPSSAVPSRSNSPIMPQSRLHMPAFARQPIQTPTNQVNRAPQIYGGQAAAGAVGDDSEQPLAPTISKITPVQGPVAGGTEVSVFGYNFTHGTQISFGDSIAPTTFYGSQSILAISPPGRRGRVHVKIVPTDGSMHYATSQSSSPIFTYTDTNPQMMEMALRFLSQQQTGDAGRWMQYTNDVANQFMQTSISPAGIQGQGFGGGNMLASEMPHMEDIVLKVFDLVDLSEVPRQPCYDLPSEGGETMLILAAALGMHRVAAALLARGATPDVRDKGGYTALMHAALHGRAKSFQLLLIKGADPTLRSLKGYSAMDLVEVEEREIFLEILQNTRRSRSARPSFHLRHSFGSYSSKTSWDISSASFYESEIEESEHAVSMPHSRRPSAIAPLPSMPEETAEPSQAAPSSAAMMAWRDALAAQIYYFQQSVHSSMSSFQMPALPPLPDYQDNAMVRRLSSLVPARYSTRPAALGHNDENCQPANQQPRFWDMFSCASPSSSAPPPAYSELFPEKAQFRSEQASKKSAVQAAIVDAVADEKCAIVFDRVQEIESEAEAVAHEAERPKNADSAVFPSWLLVSKTEPMNY